MENNFEPKTGNSSKAVRTEKIEAGKSVKLTSKENLLVVIRAGKINAFLDNLDRKEVISDSFFIFPAGDTLYVEVEKDTQLMFIHIENKMHLYKSLFFSSMQRNIFEKKEEGLFSLGTHPVLGDYFKSLEHYIDCNIDSSYFMDAKVTELFYILDTFYPKQQLAALFQPYLTNDYKFKEQVSLNYRKARSVRELAEALHYSYSGFNKRFKKVFNVSAYSWMQQQRAKMVYKELCLSNKTLKEISADYSFVSLSHFNEFCHKELGAAPSWIRKNRAGG